jgi:hypothetical protein
MKIYIPTRGRVKNQLTLRSLPPQLQEQAILVCPKDEIRRHEVECRYDNIKTNFLAQPDDIKFIADKRKWLVDTCPEDKMVMLDDDLRFAIRREDNPGLFRKATNDDILKAFQELEEILSEEVPHVSFAARGMSIGDAAKRGGWQEAKRAMYVLGYYLPIAKHSVEWGRIRIREDMDVTLQLLSMGYPNKVNYSFVTDQKAFCKGGGDSPDERTVQISNDAARQLQQLHPGYVTLSEKTFTNSPSRTEVICAWQKCLKDGIAFRTQWLKDQNVTRS